MTVTERQDLPEGDALDSGRTGALHRLTGAVPVCAALLVLVVLAALVSPSVRHRLSESFQRQPERYVELYFTDPAQATSCTTVGGRTSVLATVRSHLAGDTNLDYTATTTSAGRATTSSSGVVKTSPGRTSDFGATLTVPRGEYDVVVTLPGRTERLDVHCRGGF